MISAVSKEIGPERTGLRLAPFSYFQDTKDSDPNGHWLAICEKLASLPAAERPVYIHMYVLRGLLLDEPQLMPIIGSSLASMRF